VAQELVRSLARRNDCPAISAEELDNVIGDALDQEYFENWLVFYTREQTLEKREILFQDRKMVWYAINLTEDPDLRERGVDIMHTISSLEMELM
jgi:hypothetical protein